MAEYIVSSNSSAATLKSKGAEVIVRCKDCKYRWGIPGGYRCARGISYFVDPDNYCSWGVYREA